VFQVLQHGERSGASGTAKGRGADAGEMGEEAGAEGYFSAVLERFERNQLVPPARPAARTFLKLCDEFLQRFPGHPKTVEVKGKRSAYASIAKEWEPPTLADAKFEAKTNLRRGRFGAARQAIADYLRRNPSAPDADEAHGEMATIQVKARERFEDRFSLCQDELARAALTDSLDRRRALDRAVAYLEEADRAAAGVDEAHVAKVAAERDRLRREFGVVAREGG
jgi:hypothetical protein